VLKTCLLYVAHTSTGATIVSHFPLKQTCTYYKAVNGLSLYLSLSDGRPVIMRPNGGVGQQAPSALYIHSMCALMGAPSPPVKYAPGAEEKKLPSKR
jgi:hypothetical protein